jgi:hypothetical protein
MSIVSPDPAVLSRLYLTAVLPCLTDLVNQSADARAILGGFRGSIVLAIIGGPAVTIHLSCGQIASENRWGKTPSVILLFFGNRHLNAFFSGKRWAVPFLAWGGWRMGLLACFSKLAGLLEATLNGAPPALATSVGRRMHVRLSLIAAGLGLHPLAEGDLQAQKTLRTLPPGLASFSIEGEDAATVWFDHGSTGSAAGWSVPPRRPDVRITFADIHVAYAAMRDEIDTLAAVGSGQIKVEGLVPLADGLNFVMERLRIYLQPQSP